MGVAGCDVMQLFSCHSYLLCTTELILELGTDNVLSIGPKYVWSSMNQQHNLLSVCLSLAFVGASVVLYDLSHCDFYDKVCIACRRFWCLKNHN